MNKDEKLNILKNMKNKIENRKKSNEYLPTEYSNTTISEDNIIKLSDRLIMQMNSGNPIILTDIIEQVSKKSNELGLNNKIICSIKITPNIPECCMDIMLFTKERSQNGSNS